MTTRPEQSPPPPFVKERGVRHALTLFALVACAGAVPHLVPMSWAKSAGLDESLERFYAYRPGSPVPFTRFMTFRPPTRPTVAGIVERQEALTGDVLTDAPLPPAAPLPARPTVSPTVDPHGAIAALRIPPEAFARLPLPIERSSECLAPFYQRLRTVAEQQPGAVARILFYSDSINGSDRVSDALRKRLQARFGDAGKGWVSLARGWQSHRHQGVQWESSGWSVEVVNRGKLASGTYGLGGVVALSEDGEGRTVFETAPGRSGFDQVVLHYERHPGGGMLRFRIDQTAAVELKTAAPVQESATFAQQLPDGPHRVEVTTVQGPVRGFGVTLDRSGPGVGVDGLMLIGAFTRVLRNWDVDHWQAQIAARDPALLVFWLGGNDSVAETAGFNRREFVDDFTAVLETARAPEKHACLVVSVLDSAKDVDGELRSRRRVPRVVAAQREAAQRAGCAFFDGFRATGGRGTAARWFRHRPRLLAVDYRHLTTSGAAVFGALLEQALLEGYDRWLLEQVTSSQATPTAEVSQ